MDELVGVLPDARLRKSARSPTVPCMTVSPMKHLRTLFLLALLLWVTGCTSRPVTHVAAPAGHWTSLFNGKDLDGWTTKIAGRELNDNYQNTFRAEDGLLKVSYSGYNGFAGRFGSLFYKTRYSHYWLRAEYRFVGEKAAGAPSWAYRNSGIQLHSQAPGSMRREQEFPVAVEFDLVGGHMFGSRPTGDVCQNGTRVRINGVPLAGQCSKLSDLTIRGDQWVVAEAEVDGARRVRQVVDGRLVVEYSDVQLDPANPDARRLQEQGAGRAVESGYISIQSNGHPIEFRRIEVLVLDQAGTG
jgi:hypothetical protein